MNKLINVLLDTIQILAIAVVIYLWAGYPIIHYFEVMTKKTEMEMQFEQKMFGFMEATKRG